MLDATNAMSMGPAIQILKYAMLFPWPGNLVCRVDARLIIIAILIRFAEQTFPWVPLARLLPNVSHQNTVSTAFVRTLIGHSVISRPCTNCNLHKFGRRAFSRRWRYSRDRANLGARGLNHQPSNSRSLPYNSDSSRLDNDAHAPGKAYAGPPRKYCQLQQQDY